MLVLEWQTSFTHLSSYFIQLKKFSFILSQNLYYYLILDHMFSSDICLEGTKFELDCLYYSNCFAAKICWTFDRFLIILYFVHVYMCCSWKFCPYLFLNVVIIHALKKCILKADLKQTISEKMLLFWRLRARWTRISWWRKSTWGCWSGLPTSST